MKFPSLSSRLALILLTLTVACSVETDRQSYVAGDFGKTWFLNEAPETAYLEGCYAYVIERLAGERWLDAGPPHVCVWAGLPQPVEPGEAAAFELVAPSDAGTYRLRYTVGYRCEEDVPLSRETCRQVVEPRTAPFQVVTLCPIDRCGPRPLLPNILCEDGVSVAGPTDRCLYHAEWDLCGWEILQCPMDAPTLD